MKAKKNILELTSDYGKAESVTRMLNNNERFQMNKVFPMIKKDYSEKFGINNKNLDDVEIAQFIKNKIESGQALILPPEKVDKQKISTKLRQFKKPQLEAIIDELNRDDPSLGLKKGRVKDMVDELDSKDVYDAPRFRQLLKTPDVFAEVAPIMPIEPTAEPSVIKGVKLSTKKGIKIGKKTPETSEQALYRRLLKLSNTVDPADLPPENDDEEEKEAVAEIEKPKETMVASGIKNHVLPSTVPFGKIALDLNKLFYQNILSIKRHNGNKIIGHKNKRVSDNFVEIILKLFENKPITQSDLKNIKDEQMLYDNLIVQSGLHKSKKIPTNIEQTSEQMKYRLGLITGEIEAGNSNKSLLTELHELLFKMVRVHLISKNAAAAYYKNIKDQFYTL
jgi:hypothetical protein